MKINKIVSMTLFVAHLSSATTALAGGSSDGFDNRSVAKCSGTGGDFFFKVSNESFKGEIIQLRQNPESTIQITDQAFMAKLISLGVIDVMNWDRRPLLRGLGLNEADFVENFTTIVRTKTHDENEFLGDGLSGGTLDLLYRGNLASHLFTSEVEPTDVRQPQRQYLQILTRQESTAKYSIAVNQITSGQKVCVESKLEPNPWFGVFPDLSGSVPEMIEVCKKYETISRPTKIELAKTTISLNHCKIVSR